VTDSLTLLRMRSHAAHTAQQRPSAVGTSGQRRSSAADAVVHASEDGAHGHDGPTQPAVVVTSPVDAAPAVWTKVGHLVQQVSGLWLTHLRLVLLVHDDGCCTC